MAYTNFKLIVPDNIVILDDFVVELDLSELGADYSSIHWSGVEKSGVIVHRPDPETGELKANEFFTDPSPWTKYADEADVLRQAILNPAVFYRTEPQVTGGEDFPVGSPIVISTPNPVQPPNTTTFAPPAVEESYQELFWYRDTWLVSSVDPTDEVNDAKTALISQAKENAAKNVNLQTRIYSAYQLTVEDCSNLATADYPGYTVKQYHDYQQSQVDALISQVNKAKKIDDLFNVSPEINGLV